MKNHSGASSKLKLVIDQNEPREIPRPQPDPRCEWMERRKDEVQPEQQSRARSIPQSAGQSTAQSEQ